MKKLIILGMLLLPQLLFAGTDCQLSEYPDHYLAECTGDEKSGAVPVQSATTVKSPMLQDKQGEGSLLPPVSVSTSVVVPAATQQETSVNLKEAKSEQRPDLSRRNQAKIQAAQMKELKHKLLVESTPLGP